MSSPKIRASGSSSSVPPDYITGAGVDDHAIEVRSKLYPFAKKNLDENVLHLFENTLVLGPHWFGSVPTEMAELMKKDAEAPLCFQSSSALASHSWISKNLSRSFPSSEVRNSPVKWADWIDRLLPRYGAHWRRAGIYDVILLSKQSINRDENLLAAALCFWNSASNTFDFRVGPMAPTLLDMAQIFGFRPHGRPVDAVGDYHRRKNQEKLAKPFTISPASINQNCSFSNYLKKFSAEKDKDQQHMLFLLYWLNRFIFPNRSSAVLLEYRHLAEALHNHTDVGLGPTVLAHLFKNLYSATLENPLNLSAPGAFWMIQIWLQVYFPELRFPDVVLPEDQVLAQPLMAAEVPKRSIEEYLMFFRHCTKRSAAQWQVVIRRTCPWFQPGYRLFEKEPEEETARTDFRKRFLSVTLPRDLPYGGGKPPNYHLGAEVYHPNFCARQLGCPQLIPLKSYRSYPSLTKNIGGQTVQAGEVIVTSVISAGDLELPSVEEEDETLAEPTTVEGTSARRKRKETAPPQDSMVQLEPTAESPPPPTRSKRLRKRTVVEYVATEDTSAVPTATSGTDDELREAFEEEEIPAEVIAESIALAQKQQEETKAELTSSELALFENPEAEQSTTSPATEEQAEQPASELVEVPRSASVLAVVTSPLKPPIVAMPIHSLPGSSATASFADPELAEFEAMDLDAQLDKLEKLSSPPSKAKSRAVEEAMERLKIRRSSEPELDEDREAFDQ
ncbi:unnamed protein product [Prunus brigantina]